MKVFTSNDFEGHWPVPVAAVIVAETEGDAWVLLSEALKKDGLPGHDFTLEEIDCATPRATVLSNGDY